MGKFMREAIREHRQAKGLSMNQLAKRAQVNAKHLEKIETGSLHGMTVLTLAKLADALGMTPAQLLEGVQILRTEGEE